MGGKQHTEPAIQAKARRVNYLEYVCPTCDGELELTVSDVNSPGGRLARPCKGCNQHGRVWYREDLAPRPNMPTPLVVPLLDEQLMDLPEPRPVSP